MESLLLPALIVVANILGAGMIVPQVVRFRRHASADGVSGIWIGLGLAMNLWWLAYAAQGSLWGLIPVSAGAGSLYIVMAGQYRSIVGRGAVRSLVTGFLGLGFGPLPFLLLGGWSAAGVAIGFSYGLQFAPATLAALRAPRIGGISRPTWAMAFVEAAIWVVYGLDIGDPALLIGGAGGAFMAAVILLRVLIGERGPAALEEERPVDTSAAGRSHAVGAGGLPAGSRRLG